MKSQDTALSIRSALEGTHGNAQFKDPRPFDAGTLFWNEDGSHGIAEFQIENRSNKKTAAVSRRIYFHEEGPTADQIIEGLRDKYGREQWRDSKKALLWTSLKKGGSITPRQCSKLVKKIIPRTNMTRPWTRVFTRSERRRQTEKRLLKSEANIQKFQQCSNAVAEKYNGQWGQGNDEAVTRKFNSELTSCRRKSGLANEGSTGDAAERAPLMIGPNGSPGIYKKYRACGPMIVTLFNYSEGRLSDVSFISFDPEWIADQPAFFFSKEKSKKISRIKF